MYNRPLLGEILVERGAVRPEDVTRALQEQQGGNGLRLGEALIELELTQHKAVTEALSIQLGYPLTERLDLDQLDLTLLDKVPIGWARQRHALPLRRVDGSVQVLLEDPLDVNTTDQLGFIFGARVAPLLATRATVVEAINSAYDRHDRMRSDYGAVLGDEDEKKSQLEEPGFEDVVELLGKEDDEAPVIQFVNTTFLRAVRERASDIHIEPTEQYVSVRFRIDGVLREVIQVPKRFQSSIAARVKIMAGLNIAEKRLPQDGRIRIKIAGRDIDIRVATAPTTQGERITLRLLDQSNLLLDLEQIGMPRDTLVKVDKLIRRPHGILLVTGPTGSGKTTTLYSCLTKINSPDKNILTIEDPVEYQLKGISQTPVNPKIELTFASGLRSFLRHDPDVIMVGEIRDVETADIAIQASLTGHLVFSTIHTNDAAGAFTRLIDMGIEPFLVASSLLANMAQRLVRRLCLPCRRAYVPTDEELGELGVRRAELDARGGVFYRPVGCDECLQTGYRGRSGIYELLEVSDEIRALVMARADAGTIKRKAVEQGMRPLRRDGGEKVLAGITSTEEVLRATQEEAEL
jgi:general secretion pathway protein E